MRPLPQPCILQWILCSLQANWRSRHLLDLRDVPLQHRPANVRTLPKKRLLPQRKQYMRSLPERQKLGKLRILLRIRLRSQKQNLHELLVDHIAQEVHEVLGLLLL